MRNITKAASTLLIAYLAPFNSAHAEVPLSGDYLCTIDFMHMMNSQAGLAMISAATCTLDGNENNVVTFTNNVLFNDKGNGKLINSNGLTQVDNQPAAAFVGVESSWQLEMKDDQMTGYTANGVNDIVAGDHNGKQIHWTASPSGPDTMVISYQIKD